MTSLIEKISSAVWGWPMIILLLGTHLFLTVRLRFPQLKIGKAIRLSVTKDHGASGDVSAFGALATALAATIGTGNIVGVATAVTLGGPGAVLWCWITGVFGMSTKYAESLLAVKYRVRTQDGRMLGGPMFTLERGLHAKWLAVIFAVFTAIAAFGIGNTVQANSISLLLGESYGLSKWLIGAILATLITLVIVFGVKGIARVCSALVPFMAVLYVLGCLALLVINRHYLGEALQLIGTCAFTPKAAGGGFVGSTVMLACRYGIARGLFSNESGLGSEPIVAAAAKTRNPVRQALVSSTGTFWDTVVVCALTGLVLVSSIIAHPDIDSTHGAALTHAAFSKLPVIGPAILSVGIVTFAFSTILGWSYYGERAVEYLAGRHVKRARILTRAYKIAWVVAVFAGSVMSLGLVWNLSEIANALMTVPNLIAVLLLSGILVQETRKYLWSGRLDEEDGEEPPLLK